jgi:hypothetical protein
MRSVAEDRRAPKMTQPTSDDDSYTQLILAILHRAVQDTQGHCWSPGTQSPEQIQAEARRWLHEERELVALLELAGFDPSPVLRRVRAPLVGGRRVSAAQT